MPITKWEPFGEIDRMFTEPFFSNLPTTSRPFGFDLAVDVYEEKGTVVAKMSLPGMKSSDVDVTIEDNLLTISGHREEEKETNNKEYYSKEIRRGTFSRTVTLPTSVKADKAEAKFEDGMLMVTAPAIAAAKDRATKVKVT